jgi:hypothetical protein
MVEPAISKSARGALVAAQWSERDVFDSMNTPTPLTFAMQPCSAV